MRYKQDEQKVKEAERPLLFASLLYNEESDGSLVHGEINPPSRWVCIIPDRVFPRAFTAYVAGCAGARGYFI